MAAKPGLDNQTPRGVGGVVVPLRHTLDLVPELGTDFTENPLAGSSVQAKAPSRVVIDEARCLPSEAAQAPVSEIVGGEFHIDRERNLKRVGDVSVQSYVQIAHAPLHGAVVLGVTRRAVERQHAVMLQDFIDRLTV